MTVKGQQDISKYAATITYINHDNKACEETGCFKDLQLHGLGRRVVGNYTITGGFKKGIINGDALIQYQKDQEGVIVYKLGTF